MRQSDRVEVWLAGRLLPGADAQGAALAFARAGGMAPKAALALIAGGAPRLVARDLPPDTGRAYVEKLAAAGIVADLRPMPSAAPAPPRPERPPRPPRRAEQPVPPVRPVQPKAAPAAPKTAAPALTDVWLTGRLSPGADANRAAQAFARAANLDPQVALALLNGGAPRPLKQGLPPETGRAYVEKLAALGIGVELRPLSRTGEARTGETRTGEAPKPSRSPSRRAARAKAAPETGLLAQSGMWGEEAEELDPDIGRNWLDESLNLFLTEITVWCSALFLGCFLPSLALFLPFVCLIFFLPTSVPQNVSLTLTAGLFPLFAGGFSLLAHRQKSGERARVGLSLYGFWDNTVSLLMLGLVPLLYLALLLVVHLALRGGLPFVPGLAELPRLPRFLMKDWGYALLLSAVALPFAWMVLRLLLCAPCLVMLPGESPGRALAMSLAATGRNRGAFLRARLLTLPMPFLLALLPVLAFFANRVYTALFLIFLLIPYFAWFSVFAYLACRDIFHDDDSDF